MAQCGRGLSAPTVFFVAASLCLPSRSLGEGWSRRAARLETRPTRRHSAAPWLQLADRFRFNPEGIRGCPMASGLTLQRSLIAFAVLHDEINPLEKVDVAKDVAFHRNDVSEFPFADRIAPVNKSISARAS